VIGRCKSALEGEWTFLDLGGLGEKLLKCHTFSDSLSSNPAFTLRLFPKLEGFEHGL